MRGEPKRIASLFLKLTSAELKTFPIRPRDLDVPDLQGVYVIYDLKGTVCHVGCSYRGSRGLFQRLRNHMQTGSSFTNAKPKWHGTKLRGKYKFRYLPVEDIRERLLLESFSIGSLCPEHIGSHQSKA